MRIKPKDNFIHALWQSYRPRKSFDRHRPENRSRSFYQRHKVAVELTGLAAALGAVGAIAWYSSTIDPYLINQKKLAERIEAETRKPNKEVHPEYSQNDPPAPKANTAYAATTHSDDPVVNTSTTLESLLSSSPFAYPPEAKETASSPDNSSQFVDMPIPDTWSVEQPDSARIILPDKIVHYVKPGDQIGKVILSAILRSYNPKASVRKFLYNTQEHDGKIGAVEQVLRDNGATDMYDPTKILKDPSLDVGQPLVINIKALAELYPDIVRQSVTLPYKHHAEDQPTLSHELREYLTENGVMPSRSLLSGDLVKDHITYNHLNKDASSSKGDYALDPKKMILGKTNIDMSPQIVAHAIAENLADRLGVDVKDLGIRYEEFRPSAVHAVPTDHSELDLQTKVYKMAQKLQQSQDEIVSRYVSGKESASSIAKDFAGPLSDVTTIKQWGWEYAMEHDIMFDRFDRGRLPFDAVDLVGKTYEAMAANNEKPTAAKVAKSLAPFFRAEASESTIRRMKSEYAQRSSPKTIDGFFMPGHGYIGLGKVA